MTPVPQWLDCRGELPLPGVSLLVLAFKVSLPNHCGGLKRQHHPRHQSRRGIAGRKLKVEDKLNCQTMKQTCWTSQRDQALVSNPKWKQCCAEGGETRIRWFGYIWIGLEFGVRLAISCVEMASAPKGAGRAFEASCWGGPRRKRRKDMHRFLGQVWTSELTNSDASALHIKTQFCSADFSLPFCHHFFNRLPSCTHSSLTWIPPHTTGPGNNTANVSTLIGLDVAGCASHLRRQPRKHWREEIQKIERSQRMMGWRMFFFDSFSGEAPQTCVQPPKSRWMGRKEFQILSFARPMLRETPSRPRWSQTSP